MIADITAKEKMKKWAVRSGMPSPISPGAITEAANPNGSTGNIAGIYNDKGHVLGMMPHPERLIDPAQSGTDGAKMFSSLVEALH